MYYIHSVQKQANAVCQVILLKPYFKEAVGLNMKPKFTKNALEIAGKMIAIDNP